MRCQFTNQLFFERPDLRLKFTFPNPYGHLWKECIYGVIVPKGVEFFPTHTARARRLITQLQRKRISTFVGQGLIGPCLHRRFDPVHRNIARPHAGAGECRPRNARGE